MSWDSSLSEIKDYGLDDRSSISGRGGIFLFAMSHILALGSKKTPVQRVLEALSLELKQPVCENNNLHPSSAGVLYLQPACQIQHMAPLQVTTLMYQ
jgi:hypothetical protein